MKKKPLANEEKVLQILINKYNDSKTNSVYAYKSDFTSLNMTESEITRSIYLLQEDALLTIIKKSNGDDLSMPWMLSLKSAGVRYFDNKSKNAKTIRREWVRTYLPVTISFIALLKSFSSEITSLVKLIMQLLK